MDFAQGTSGDVPDNFDEMPVIRHKKWRHVRRPGRAEERPAAPVRNSVLAEEEHAAALQHHSHAKAMPHSQLGIHDLEQAPVDAGGRVKVAFAFYATKILSLDHLENTLRIVGFVRQWWYDPRLEWDGEGPEQFRPKKSSEIWKPDTTLMNSVQFNYREKCQDVDLYNYAKGATVKVGDGRMKFNVFWSRPCMLEAKCDVNLRWFPFDRNECHRTFKPWTSPHV